MEAQVLQSTSRSVHSWAQAVLIMHVSLLRTPPALLLRVSRADGRTVVSIKNGKVFIDRWQNQDHGGTTVRGDGTRYCDMTGDGSDDYVVRVHSQDTVVME